MMYRVARQFDCNLWTFRTSDEPYTADDLAGREMTDRQLDHHLRRGELEAIDDEAAPAAAEAAHEAAPREADEDPG